MGDFVYNILNIVLLKHVQSVIVSIDFKYFLRSSCKDGRLNKKNVIL